MRTEYAQSLRPGEEAIASSRLEFCLPISINLCHRDLVALTTICLHFLTAVILTAVMPSLLLLPAGIVLMCSLRMTHCVQRRLTWGQCLHCNQSGNWYVESQDGKQFVRFDTLSVVGPVCFIRLRCFGSRGYWITTKGSQSRAAWSRLRVLGQLL